MTTNKPHIEAYLVTRIKNEGYGKPRRILDAEIYDPTSGSFFVSGAKENHTVEPLVPLSDYEALQAECEKLRKHLQNLIDQTTPLEPEPGNPMWSRRIKLDEVIAERDHLQVECKKLVEALESLIKGYVRLLEAGMVRITSLGGECDPVPVMEQNDPWLRDANAALADYRKGDDV